MTTAPTFARRQAGPANPEREQDWPAPGVERLPLFPRRAAGGLHLQCLPAGILAGADPGDCGHLHFRSPASRRTLMIGSVLLVLVVELLNSAVEAADHIGLERHQLSKQTQDIGSAAVFVALVNVVCDLEFRASRPLRLIVGSPWHAVWVA